MGRVKKAVMIAAIVTSVLSIGSCTWFLSIFNSFRVAGKSYSLDKMIIQVDGPYDGLYGVDIIMMSEDLDIADSGFLTGEGHIVVLSLISSDNGIAEDDYVWGPDFTDPIAGLLLDGLAAANVVGETETPDVLYWLTDGSLSVRQTVDGALHLEGDFEGEEDSTSSVATISLSYRGEVDEERDLGMLVSTAPTLILPME